jgi:peptidoglycan/LPS O-acetylase OafA/YrhL
MSRHTGFLTGLLGILGLLLVVVGFLGLIFFPRPGVICFLVGFCLCIWSAGSEQARQNQPSQKEKVQ